MASDTYHNTLELYLQHSKVNLTLYYILGSGATVKMWVLNFMPMKSNNYPGINSDFSWS